MKKYIIHPGIDKISNRYVTGDRMIKLCHLISDECIIDTYKLMSEEAYPDFLHFYADRSRYKQQKK